MTRAHIRPILYAFTVALLLVSISLAYGLTQPTQDTRPLYLTCAELGHNASDTGLANCASELGLACGSAYTDHLREDC